MFTLAHLSDLHLPLPPGAPRWRALASKRVLGYLSYRLKRKMVHDQAVLAALVDDLCRHAPDHIVITGDLTNIGLPEEFAASARWLQALRASDGLTVIPGNHDAYVGVPWQQSFERWSAFMSETGTPIREAGDFPFVRRRGEVALIGVSTACPSSLVEATGRIGAAQLARLGRQLEQLGAQALFRVVLIHHPPIAGMVSYRKRLTDQAAFRAVIARSGAELILHGHHHRFTLDELATPHGKAPVIGVPSGSARRAPGHEHASYHLCRLHAEPGRWRLEVEVRGLAETTDRFVSEHRFDLTIANPRSGAPLSSAMATP
ncbi:MAG TPA: metallophosphoesterase [Geminicoccaceae bacterium]|nr:metallophosphoesterase [Geminicoccaceae bacterium]